MQLSRTRMKIARFKEQQLDELEEHLESPDFEYAMYLNIETGDLESVEMKEVYQIENMKESREEETDMEDGINANDSEEYQRYTKMEEDPNHYVALPEVDSWIPAEDRKKFINNLTDDRLSMKLEKAFNGKGAFGRFSDILADYPKWRDEWFAFERECKGSKRFCILCVLCKIGIF